MSTSASQDSASPVQRQPNGWKHSRISPELVSVHVSREQSVESTADASNQKKAESPNKSLGTKNAGNPKKTESTNGPQSNGNATVPPISRSEGNKNAGSPMKTESTKEPQEDGCCWMGMFNCCKRKKVRPTFQPYRVSGKLCGRDDKIVCSGFIEKEENKESKMVRCPKTSKKPQPPSDSLSQGTTTDSKKSETQSDSQNAKKNKEDHWYQLTKSGEIYCSVCTATQLCSELKMVKQAEKKQKTKKETAGDKEKRMEQLYLDLKTLDHIITKKGIRRDAICEKLHKGEFADTAKKLLGKYGLAASGDKDKKAKSWLAGIKLYTLRIVATAVASQQVQNEQKTEEKKSSGEKEKRFADGLTGEDGADYLALLVKICDISTNEDKEPEKGTTTDSQKPKTQSDSQKTAKELKFEKILRVRQLEAALVQLFYIAPPGKGENTEAKADATQEKAKSVKAPQTARESRPEPSKTMRGSETARGSGKESDLGKPNGTHGKTSRAKTSEQSPDVLQTVKTLLDEYKEVESPKIQALALLVLSHIAPGELQKIRPPDEAIGKLVSWILITQDVQNGKDGQTAQQNADKENEFPYGIRFRAEDLLEALTLLAEKEQTNSTQIWMAIEDYIEQLYSKKKQGDKPVAEKLLRTLLKENTFVSERVREVAPDRSKIMTLWNEVLEGKQQPTGAKGQGSSVRPKVASKVEDETKTKLKCDIEMVETAIKLDKMAVVENVTVPEDLVQPTAKDKVQAQDPKEAEMEKQKVLYQLMEKAIEQNKGDFARHFIQRGIDLDGMINDNAETWNKRAGLIEDQLKKILPELNRGTRDHAMKKLLTWCLYSEKQEVALVFWRLETEKMAAALYAKTMLKAQRMEAGNAYLSESIKTWEQEWEDNAYKILEECQKSDLGKAVELVQLQSEVWGGASCVDIAIKGKARKFLSASSVQVYIDKLWVGHLHFDNFRDIWPRVRFVLALLFPPVLFALKYNTDEDFSASSYPGAKREDKSGQKKGNESSENSNVEEKKKPEEKRDLRLTVVKFYSAPLVKCWTNAILYIIFLIVFSYMILVEFSTNIQGAEIVVYIWMFTFIVQEIYEIWNLVSRAKEVGEAQKKVALRLYFFNVWNILDLISLAGFVLGLAVRLVVVIYPNANCRCIDAARVIFALDFIILCCRFLHIIAVDSYLGAKLVIIRRMYKDLVGFVAILLVFVAAYAIASETVLYPNTPLTARLPFYLLRKAYFNIYGELFLDELSGHTDCTHDFDLYQNYTVTRCPTDYGVYVSQMMLGGYILFMNILLLNLLIAMFSYTFDQVMTKQNAYWHYERARLVHEFLLRPILPPPFILLWFIYKFLRWLRNAGCCCCWSPQSPVEQNEPDSLEAIDEAVKNPPWLLEEQSGPPSLIQETNSTDLKNWGTRKANEVASQGDDKTKVEPAEPDYRLDELQDTVNKILERVRGIPDAAPNKWQACFHVLSPYTGITHDGAHPHNKKGAPPLNFDTRVYNPNQPVRRFSPKKRVVSRKGRRASQHFQRQYTPLYSYNTEQSTSSGGSPDKDRHNFFEDGTRVMQPSNLPWTADEN